MTSISRRKLIGPLVFTAGAPYFSAAAWSKPFSRSHWHYEAVSPNGRLRVSLADGPSFAMLFDGAEVLARAPTSLRLANGQAIGRKAVCLGCARQTIRGTWSPPYGIRQHYYESCEEILVSLLDTETGIRFDLVARAYDDGAAIRTVIRHSPKEGVMFSGDVTHFALPHGTKVYASRDEGDYQIADPSALAPVPDPELTTSSDSGPLADMPMTAILPSGVALLITESDRVHYPRTMLRSAAMRGALVTQAMQFPGRATGWSGPGDTPPSPTFALRDGEATPWRVVIAAKNEAGLIEKAGLVPTLARPNQIGDTAWIKPGRAIRVRVPYTTERAMGVVRFASLHKLEYIEFDAHWYGDGTDASDATRPINGLDLRAVIEAAKSAGVGTILYVDRVPATNQLDDLVRLYRAWGVAGIKFGFVWEGRQADNDLIFRMVQRCGENHLLVNLHDDLRPAGAERTLPNYIALEGVRGNEHFPTARHNVTLPFTRNVAGAMDYTICYAHPKNQTTNAHQLAMAAVYYSPLTFLYWYDEPSKYAAGAWPELAWFDACPTSWDETRALDGRIGQHVAIARRQGRRWFLGAMTNEEARILKLSLSFLGTGRWQATIYADGVPAGPANQTPVVIRQTVVDRTASLEVDLKPSGGQAVMFEPLI